LEKSKNSIFLKEYKCNICKTNESIISEIKNKHSDKMNLSPKMYEYSLEKIKNYKNENLILEKNRIGDKIQKLNSIIFKNSPHSSTKFLTKEKKIDLIYTNQETSYKIEIRKK